MYIDIPLSMAHLNIYYKPYTYSLIYLYIHIPYDYCILYKLTISITAYASVCTPDKTLYIRKRPTVYQVIFIYILSG